MKKTKVGVIGCGNISKIYFENLTKIFQNVEVVAAADLMMERAQEAAEKYGLSKSCSPEELLADPEVEIVLNITIPQAHFEVCMAALEAGKHVYVEKPLSLTREQGLALKQKAAEKGLLLGGAPDTFLGGGIQTCIKLINDGWIGTPIGATAFMTCHGHESWHPDPEFYYKAGGGPMFDMGPYYLTALVAMMGPIERISGMTQKTFETRTITSEKKFGQIVDVDVPTHVCGMMKFANGSIGTILTSFDIWGANLPRIEVYGTEGSLSVPDPNSFGGPVSIKKPGYSDFEPVPLSHIYGENSRGLGLADMAYALQTGGINRANGDLAYHVLDAMHAFHDAADAGCEVKLQSTCMRPEPLPTGLTKGIF